MFYLKFQIMAPGFDSPQYAEIVASDYESATNVMIAELGQDVCLPVRPYTFVTLYSADPKFPNVATPVAHLNIKRGDYTSSVRGSFKLSREHPLESKVQQEGRFRVQFREYGFVPAYKTNGQYYTFDDGAALSPRTESFSKFQEAQNYIDTRKFVVKSDTDVQVLHQLIDDFVNDTPSLIHGVTTTTSGFPATLMLHVKTPNDISIIQAKRGEPSWLFVRETDTKPGHDRLFIDVPAIDYTIEHGTFYKSQPVIEDLVVQKRDLIRQQLHQELNRILESSDVKRYIK